MYIKFFPKDGLVGVVTYYINEYDFDKEKSKNEKYLRGLLGELSDIADQFSKE